jgi:hypothetical protein
MDRIKREKTNSLTMKSEDTFLIVPRFRSEGVADDEILLRWDININYVMF